MPNKPYTSQFTYSEDELELNKIISFLQSELQTLRSEGARLNENSETLLLRAESLARQKGISEEQLQLFKIQAKSIGESRSIPEPGCSWSDLVDKANSAIPGYVTLEDICSAQDFEDAFRHIDEIEHELENKTKLTKMDMAFIVIAIALQCARQYVLQPFLDTHRLTAKQNDDVIKKVVPKSWQDILCGSVPYDAVTRLDKTSPSTGLSGSTHRYRTLGHDPLLGWLFGPVNILSDTLTKSDFITSYQVVSMKIGKEIPTLDAFSSAYEQAKIRYNLPVSVARQGIHFGSDYFSKQGLPLPIISSINNDVSKYLIQNNINMLNVSEGLALSALINTMIACVHRLFNVNECDSKLYEVRTRKILSISNAISLASNIACVAITKNIKVLDFGGLLITISRLCSDVRFIARVKQEFIEGKLNEEWEQISRDIDKLCMA